MITQDLLSLYAKHARTDALAHVLADNNVKTIALNGLYCSALPLVLASTAVSNNNVFLCILDDAEEAGYFYHDLMCSFFPLHIVVKLSMHKEIRQTRYCVQLHLAV